MAQNKNKWFVKGIRDGIPIGLGYFAVAFALGIAAKDAGLTPFQAMLASFTLNASAGEYAGFTVIKANAPYIEAAIMLIVANARYLLMSCALSQKLSPETPTWQRMLIGYDVTDEIFGICVSVDGKLEPNYAFGAMCVAIPGWSIGTFLGTLMGTVLPARLVSALSVALFGMFLAIIIPPARKSKILAGVIIASMAASYAFSYIKFISSGMKIIILTVVISAVAAARFPVQEAQNDA